MHMTRLQIAIIVLVLAFIIVLTYYTFKPTAADIADTTCTQDIECPDKWAPPALAVRKCDQNISRWAQNPFNMQGPGKCTITCPTSKPYANPATFTCDAQPPPKCKVGSNQCGESMNFGVCNTDGFCQCASGNHDPNNGCLPGASLKI